MPQEDLYDDAATAEERPQARTEDTSEQTALIPKSLCPGMKPGDKIELTITAEHDEEYVVEYSHETPEKEKADHGNAEMASMKEPAMDGGMYD